MKCRYCGAELEEDSLFCEECGHKAEPAEEEKTPEKPEVQPSSQSENISEETITETEPENPVEVAASPESIEPTEQAAAAVTEPETPQTAEAQNAENGVFSFDKGKMMGSVTYRRIKTNAYIKDGVIYIEQSTKKIFRKERTVKIHIDMQKVVSSELKLALDFWDTLYAIIFAVLGFFRSILFIIAAICLFSGYGKSIIIKTDDGSKFKIPTAALEGDKAQGFLKLCTGGEKQ